jgi:hypothetical protein
LLLNDFGEFDKPGMNKVFGESSSLYAVVWKRCHNALTEVFEGRPPPAPLQKLNCPRKAFKGGINPRNSRNKPHAWLLEERAFVQQWLHQGKEDADRAAAREA